MIKSKDWKRENGKEVKEELEKEENERRVWRTEGIWWGGMNRQFFLLLIMVTLINKFKVSSV